MDDCERVRMVYRGILGREPDPEALDFWATRLGQGVSLDEIADDIGSSHEAVRHARRSCARNGAERPAADGLQAGDRPATSPFDVPQVKYAESHGAVDGHQSVGALYFSLPYMLRARRCVVIGSGAGFVPLMVLAAQRRLVDEGVLERVDTTLVDANLGDWGLPVYCRGEEIDPDLRLVRQRSADVAQEFADIDYLHIDADHSYEGVKSDLTHYVPRLAAGNWAITVHDTDNPGAVQVGLPLGAWEAAEDFATERGLAIVNFPLGCGTALIVPRFGTDRPKPSMVDRVRGWLTRPG